MRSIKTLTDENPIHQNDRKEEFVAKKPSFNNSFQSKKLNRRPCHEADNAGIPLRMASGSQQPIKRLMLISGNERVASAVPSF
ncbi:MAG: hypothetical protein VYA10_08035 [Verrucomicrobiota bacterium]|nr:hypothetical protein [Verrucomicrobiota bacterium]